MVSLNDLRARQTDARNVGDDLGVVTRDLSDKELIRFGRSFERQFIRGYDVRQIVDLHVRHKSEALLGAMIAKEQMDAEIDSEQPASNKVGGPLAIEAQWFGVGDDWEDLASIYGTAVAAGQGFWTPGAPQDWIHSGTFLMGGTDGNAIRIGENAVHVIYGLASIHPSPKIESIQFTIDDKEKPKLLTFFAQKQLPGAVRAVKELDNCYILNKDKTILAEVFMSDAFGATVTELVDYPVLFGVSYIKEPALRLLDPDKANHLVVGTRYEVVHTT